MTDEALVLVPGMMCDARVFWPQILGLTPDYAVHVAPIAPADTIEAMAEAILATAPQQFALAGLSMGAIIAMEIMRRAPERVNRVALISASAQAERPPQAAERDLQIVRATSGRLDEVMGEVMRPEYLAPIPEREEILALVHQMARRLGPEAFASQSRALQRRPDQQKTLRITRVPALVICGEHDTLTPVKRHEFIAELIPQAALEVIPEAGHLPTIEAPEAMNRILREWLAGPLVLR